MIGEEQFLDLMSQFLEQQIYAETFCTHFMELWTQNRDIMYARKLTWSEPHDEKLIASFQCGEITDKEFSEKFALLWGYEDALPLQNMIDAVHSVCSVFRPVPTFSWEIDEDRLRLEVARELVSYKSDGTIR